MSKDFLGKVEVTRNGVDYGPFEVDLEKVERWDDVFAYIEPELEEIWLKIQHKFGDPDAEFDFYYDAFQYAFVESDHDEFFASALKDGWNNYNWQRHCDLQEALFTAAGDDQETLDAIIAWVNAGCSPGDFREAYRGSFRSGADFAEDYFTELMDNRHLLQHLVIDWDATWHGMYDFVEYDGHFFYNT